ncbi:MAG: GNAT family N-acetyltransferase, partial [Pyrinomonadaceae bacterium]
YVTLDDFDEMMEMFHESRAFYKGLINPAQDYEGFKIYVERNLDEANECFVICRKADKKIIGAVNLSQIFRKGFQNAYLGYSLGAKYTGKGFMTEAINLILKYSFNNLKLHRIEANIQPHNTASIAVVKRCGFSKECFSPKYLKISGKWRDHERWAIIEENWGNETSNKNSDDL